jgi:hypothetical protein
MSVFQVHNSIVCGVCICWRNELIRCFQFPKALLVINWSINVFEYSAIESVIHSRSFSLSYFDIVWKFLRCIVIWNPSMLLHHISVYCPPFCQNQCLNFILSNVYRSSMWGFVVLKFTVHGLHSPKAVLDTSKTP